MPDMYWIEDVITETVTSLEDGFRHYWPPFGENAFSEATMTTHLAHVCMNYEPKIFAYPEVPIAPAIHARLDLLLYCPEHPETNQPQITLVEAKRFLHAQNARLIAEDIKRMPRFVANDHNEGWPIAMANTQRLGLVMTMSWNPAATKWWETLNGYQGGGWNDLGFFLNTPHVRRGQRPLYHGWDDHHTLLYAYFRIQDMLPYIIQAQAGAALQEA